MTNWRKSTYSQGASNCVQVGRTTGLAVRDTKLGESSPVLTVSEDTWTKFLRSLFIRSANGLTGRVESGMLVVERSMT